MEYTPYFIRSDRHSYEIAYISPPELLEGTKTSSNTEYSILVLPMANWLDKNIFLTMTKNNTASSDAIEPTAPDFIDGARPSATLYPSLHEQQQQHLSRLLAIVVCNAPDC